MKLDTTQQLETLRRLIKRAEMAIHTVEMGLIVSDPNYHEIGDRNYDFRIGEFCVKERDSYIYPTDE